MVSLTQALVLENALTTLHTDAVIGIFYVDDPAPGRASWARRSRSGSPPCWRPQARAAGPGDGGSGDYCKAMRVAA